jgi:voltage-gated potassium channel
MFRPKKPIMNSPSIEALYIVSMKEIFWGGILVAITMAMHGFGMLMVLRINHSLKLWLETKKGLMTGLLPVIFASCLIMVVHLSEVAVWAAFFYWKQAFPNASISFYFSLNEYTTVGSRFSLPIDWRLLEGMIASAGLLTFALSTGILFGLAKTFLEQPLELFNRRKNQASRMEKKST